MTDLELTETPAQRRARRIRQLVRSVLFAVLTYAAVVLVARLLHRRVLYQPPDEAGVAELAGATTLTLRARDGVVVHAFEFAGAGPRTVVHFHGNAETADQNATLAKLLGKQGLGVVLVEYRGYGASKGVRPDEQGVYRDAEAVLDDLVARGKTPADIVLWGQSLGSGVATEMARQGRGARLVLVAPFTSTVDMARASVPFLPASLVMQDTFDNVGKAPLLPLPVSIAHGDSDTVIPFAQGKRLSETFPHAEFREVPMGTHTNLYKDATTFQRLVEFAKR